MAIQHIEMENFRRILGIVSIAINPISLLLGLFTSNYFSLISGIGAKVGIS